MVFVYLFIYLFSSFPSYFLIPLYPPGITNDDAISRPSLGACFYILYCTKRRELVSVIRVRLGRLAFEQRHLQTFALSPPILEPELHVFRLQSGKLLPVWHPVQLLRVFQNQRVTGMSIVSEPSFESGHFRHRIDERPVPFPPFVQHTGRTTSWSTRRQIR